MPGRQDTLRSRAAPSVALQNMQELNARNERPLTDPVAMVARGRFRRAHEPPDDQLGTGVNR